MHAGSGWTDTRFTSLTYPAGVKPGWAQTSAIRIHLTARLSSAMMGQFVDDGHGTG
jgi:hypothetical protein